MGVRPDSLRRDMSTNFISGEPRKGEDGKFGPPPLARDVLAAQLDNFASTEKIEFLATQHELRTGQVLLRDGETPAEFKERRKLFLKEHGKKFEKAAVVINPSSARQQLTRMERSYRTRSINWDDEKQAAIAREDFRLMNEFRRILGMEQYDYENTAVPQLSTETHDRYAKFSTLPDAETKIAALATVDDPELARLIATHDSNEKVRAEAETRFGQLLMTGKV